MASFLRKCSRIQHIIFYLKYLPNIRIGDVIDLVMAYMVVKTCEQVQPPLPASLRSRMQLNLAIDFLIGLVPFIGDLADAVYKCNTRNAVLLENELRKRGEQRIRASGQQPQIDPTLPENFDDGSDEERFVAQNGPPPRYTSTKEARRSDRRQDPDLEAGLGAPPVQPPRPAASNSRRDRHR